MGQHLLFVNWFSCHSRVGGADRVLGGSAQKPRHKVGRFCGKHWVVLALRRPRMDLSVPIALPVLNDPVSAFTPSISFYGTNYDCRRPSAHC